MATDILQEKIRKSKSPILCEISLGVGELPTGFSADAAGYGRFCLELLSALKGIVPGVRIGFSSFALLGGEGLAELEQVLRYAVDAGFYVLLDAPEIWSAQSAAIAAETLLGENRRFSCDGIVISGFQGSDLIRPFLPFVKKQKRDVFVICRNANKSASEVQDLLSGSRLVHLVLVDHVNRYGGDTVGKYGYSRLGVLAATVSGDSLRTIRSKYPNMFMVLDGYDYPQSSAKNCAFAFDKFGHGAVVCGGRSITCAWMEAEEGSADWIACSVSAVERMKRNLTRYVTIM